MYIVSGGYLGDQEITVENNRITLKGTGSLPDGGKNTFTVTRTFSEGGTKFVDSGTGDIDGVATDQALQTWRKVSGKYEPEAAAKELAEFGKRLQGRWVRDIVYVHDWKGAPGGKGAKATGYHEFIWINDGHALREVNYDGESRAESIMCWDPVSKGIFALGTTATGDSFLGQWKKTADHQWTLTPLGGGTADGKKFGGELTYTFSEDGSRIDCRGVITLDGEPLNELEDVLHRLSP